MYKTSNQPKQRQNEDTARLHPPDTDTALFMDTSPDADTASLHENVVHGSAVFPCAYYRADSGNYAPDEPFVCKHHWHEEIEILYLEKGRYRLEINREHYTVTGPCFAFVRSGELHAIFSDGDFSERAIVFSAEFLRFAANDPVQKRYMDPLIRNELALPRLLTPESPSFDRMQALYTDIMDCFQSCGSDIHGRPDSRYIAVNVSGQLRIKAALLGILAELAVQDLLSQDIPAPDSHVELIKDSITFMREHYAEKLYIADLANHVNLNKEYFCRFFKSVIGRPPIEYLNELRIRQAVRLLRETDEAVADIALACGFNNLGNFNRTFKKYTGSTPLRYRKD